MTTGRNPRRTPTPGERQRDPERTRARILDAAKVEFGAKGFAGARVSDIADRAGVNKQLISYYFGGKEGLFAELSAQWRQASATLANPDQPLDAMIAGFTMSTVHYRDWARMMVWANLDTGGASPDTGQDDEFLRDQVADIRRRQGAGELPADLDPACVLLALFAAASATVTLPRIVKAICGEDADSDEFTRHYSDQLARLIRHLGNSRPPASDQP
ncbi:MAG: TetR/AcrR family transcriptional regulator [Actinophytocola sp.]|uniref:TetR/AcrR family transcriptional regulator n=1 Tax=Actinophytocola sp. TaxID=1872138 RepID=UPI003D6BB321